MADYGKLKVTELRELLKERGIASTGLTRKQQIVEALEAHDNEGPGEAAVAPTEEEAVEEEKEEEAQEPGAPADEPEPAQTEVAEEPDASSEQPVQPEETKEAETETPQPTVPLQIPEEIHQPVSNTASKFATPQRTSPAPSAGSTESRKRKRRSPTPPVSAETINKRLKSAEEDYSAKLPEDEVIEDAPAPTQPDSTTDTAMDTAMDTAVTQTSNDDPMDTSETSKPSDPTPTSDVPTIPSLHPATTALYIRNLVRPVQPTQLRDHLTHIALPPNVDADDSIITVFHLDTLRSHAFVKFSSISAAARARSALHDQIWPEEPSRRPLWVDFIPDDKVQEWIDTELNSETSRRDAKRWEVVYETSLEVMTTVLKEVTAAPPSRARQPSASTVPPVVGPGMPNAPLGPRSDRRRPSATEPPAKQSESFNILDERFKSTTAKPKLYFLPQPGSLADKRLAELEDKTSRDWADVRVSKLRGRDGQLVRYTFENGDEVVDGGVDLGDFGRGGGGGDRGGRRRGGGGFRGRR